MLERSAGRDRLAASMAGVYLARHGQTAYNLRGPLPGPAAGPARRHRPRTGARAGRACRAHTASSALWCSPLLRARETADIVAARIGLDPARGRAADGDRRGRLDGSQLRRACRPTRPSSSRRSSKETRASPSPAGSPSPSRRCAWARRSTTSSRAPSPALVVCHGMVIRAALSVRAGHWIKQAQRVANGALVPLDPDEAERADLGGGEATAAS